MLVSDDRSEKQLKADRIEEDQAVAALATTRDKASAAEWKVHNPMLLAKDQVRAQFGKDSTELQEIGLKRTSNYRRPGRRGRAKVSQPPA